VKQSTLVTSRGGTDAPAVTTLTLTSPVSAPITSTSTTSASFALETSVEPDSVVWLVDGIQEGVATGSDTEFSFQWTLPSLDGAYEVKAQAFDIAAVSGETKSLTVVLNRYSPAAPTGFNAGRNGTVVEAEWAANRERDIIGYRVYRRLGSASATLACSTTTETSCIDANPPNRTSTTLSYWVVALDRSPLGATREGASSPAINVNLGNNSPNAPTDLVITTDEMGRVVLSWALPSPGDPDSGDEIQSFRIYRGGTTVGDRYDRTGSGTSTTFVDEEPLDATTQYWITAVDSHLHESALVGPVALGVPEEPAPEDPAPGGGTPEGGAPEVPAP
jgi:hypothetical protein